MKKREIVNLIELNKKILEGNRYKSISKETFGQEHVVSKKLTNDSKTETTTNRGKLNYYA